MRFAHTYSIVAVDRESGRLGAAVQSHWFNVADVLWVKAGVAAVATQSLAAFDYGPRLLANLEDGGSPGPALRSLLSDDPHHEVRQITAITPEDRAAAHTGSRCIEFAGHRIGDDYCAAANMVARAGVWEAMGDSFESERGDLSSRLMAALEAAETEGGDLRGQQSAVLLVVAGRPSGRSWEDKVIDIRVDDHPQPLRELRRSLSVAKAYDYMIQGEKLLAARRPEEAVTVHEKALALAPDRTEIMFWTAVAHANNGNIERAVPLLRRCYEREGNWRDLVRRLPEPGLLPDDPDLLARLIGD